MWGETSSAPGRSFLGVVFFGSRTKSISLHLRINHGKPLLVGIYRAWGIAIPGFLRWRRILSIHSIESGFAQSHTPFWLGTDGTQICFQIHLRMCEKKSKHNGDPQWLGTLLPFFCGEFPYKIGFRKKGTLILTSLLEDLGGFPLQAPSCRRAEATMFLVLCNRLVSIVYALCMMFCLGESWKIQAGEACLTEDPEFV